MLAKSKRKLVTNNEIKDKRVKTIVDNNKNTLFNYFKSNKTSEEKPDDKNILSEEKPALKIDCDIIYVESEKKEEIKLEVNDIKIEFKSTEIKCEAKQAWLKIFQKPEVKTSQIKAETKDLNEIADDKSQSFNRKCPFYKFITNSKITVDAFNYGVIENCDAYFLSHFHYDHYIGLKKSFQQVLYCSQITANLVKEVIKVDSKYIRPLPLNKFQNIYLNNPRIQVCLLDANHCPGSVMFLFYLADTKRYILHTGDFRAGPSVIENPLLQNINIDQVYLDTTYLDSYYKFESQDIVIKLGVKTIKEELKKYPDSLVICGSYTIGKERVYTSIAEEIGCKIYVRREKKKILDCLDDEKLKSKLTLDPNETNLHVLPMNILNMNDLTEYLGKFPAYKRIIAIKPTGWTHNSDSSLNVDSKKPNAILYGLAYSEHSSFNELKTFVKHFKPKRIIPTVNVANKINRDKMNDFFKEWINI